MTVRCRPGSLAAMPMPLVRYLARVLAPACIAALLLALALPVAAQTTSTEKPPEVNSAEIEKLVQQLEDPDARAKLIAELKALKAAQDKAEGVTEEPGLGALVLTTLSDNMREASDGLTAVTTALLNPTELIGWFSERINNPEIRNIWLEALWKIAAILAAAMAVEWALTFLLIRPQRSLEAVRPSRYWWRLPYTILHLLLELVPIAAFLVVAFAAMSILAPTDTTRLVALAIINANLLSRLIVAVVRAALVPKAPGLRLLPVSDETANYLMIWVRRLSAAGVYGYFIAEAGLLLGLPPTVHVFLLRIVGLLVAAMLVIFILQNRVPVAAWLKGRSDEGAWARLRRRFADVWHILAIVYVLAVYGVWALDIEGGFRFLFRASVMTVLLLVVVRLVTAGISNLVKRGFALSSDLKERFPGLEMRANRYLPLVQRVLFAAIYVMAALSLLEAWGLDAYGWIASDFGQRLTRSLITIGFLLLGAMLATEIVNGIVERFLRQRQLNADDPGRGARLRTLLP